MSDILTPLTIDFLAWLAAEPRDYMDVMDAGVTSCPRLTIWEDAIDAGLIVRSHSAGQQTRIELSRDRQGSPGSAWPLKAGRTWRTARIAILSGDPSLFV